MREIDSQEELVGEVRQRQRNVVFPDTPPSGASVDALFWRGDPKANRVQRWGTRLFGSFFCLCALGILAALCGHPDDILGVFLTAAVAMAFFYLGARMVRRSFLREVTPEKHVADD